MRPFALFSLALLALTTGCPTPEPADTDDTDTTGETDPPDDTDDTDDTDPVPTFEHCGDVAADETWEKGVHTVTCDVYVEGATLTIGAGADVRFDADQGLYVGYQGGGGRLSVDGTAEEPVRMRPSGTAQRGAWSGVWIGGDTARATLAHASIEHAGGSYTDAALTAVDALLTVDHLTITGAKDAGFELRDAGAFSDSSTHLVVADSDLSGRADASQAHTIPTTGLSLDGADDAHVVVTAGTISQEVEWFDLGVPYLVNGDLYVETESGSARLALGAGVIVEFAPDYGLYVGYGAPGAFATQGTDADPVVLRGTVDDRGAWSGVLFSDHTVGARSGLTWTFVENGGGNYLDGAVSLRGSTVKLADVTITGAEDHGFDVDDASAFADGSVSLTVTDSDAPGRLAATAVGSLPPGSSLVGNDVDALMVQGGGILSESVTWYDHGVPLWIDQDLYVDGDTTTAVLTLDAGVRLAFGQDYGLYVGYNGGPAGLKVQGTGDGIVSFGAISEEPGGWQGIGIYDSAVSSQTVFEYADIGYGGGSYLQANLVVDGADPWLTEVYLHDSAGWGLRIASGNPVLDAVGYADNASGDVSDER